MYDTFLIQDAVQLQQKVKTKFFYLTDDLSKIDPLFIPSCFDAARNFIFVNENCTDSFYLLDSHAPKIDNSATLIKTDRHIENCYDIIFLSNGEANANEHYDRLQALGLKNRIARVDGIKGRNEAYRACARASHSPYYFNVFAKLLIEPQFDFSFGVNSFDTRHYVFNSLNPINGLEYGHQGVILYNREMVLKNDGAGLDFTMAQLYRSIPVCSGVAMYNYSPLSAWRTAFRECLKLSLSTDTVSAHRLKLWQQGWGENSQYSIKGARDAIQFYQDHRGQPEAILKSYEWAWLEDYFKFKQ